MDLKKIAKQTYAVATAKATETNKVEIGEIERAELLTYTVNNSQFFELTKGTSVIKADTTELQVVKNQASLLQEKKGVGAGSPNEWRIGEVVKVQWNQPLQSFEAVTAVELKFADKAISIPAKMEKMLNQFAQAFERTSFAKLEDKIIADTKTEQVDLMSKTPQEAWRKVVDKATELVEIYDEKQGLDGVAPEDIIIIAKPKVMTYLASAGFAGNRVDLTFSKGQYAVYELGGFKAMSSSLLKKFDVIVTTRFVAAAAVHMLALTSAKIDNLSNDEGVYLEGMFASGILWDNLALGIHSETSTPTVDTTPTVKVSPSGDLELKGKTE